MYANDIELFASMESKEEIESNLNHDMQNLLSHFRENELIINLEPGKTEIMLFGTAKRLNTIVEKIEVSYSQQKFSFMKSTSILETWLTIT